MILFIVTKFINNTITGQGYEISISTGLITGYPVDSGKQVIDKNG
jgi:hypothetical protein